jgi:predicted transglutaminase-like protease
MCHKLFFSIILFEIFAVTIAAVSTQTTSYREFLVLSETSDGDRLISAEDS